MVLMDLLLGLGVFLFGMMQLERSIESLTNQWLARAHINLWTVFSAVLSLSPLCRAVL